MWASCRRLPDRAPPGPREAKLDGVMRLPGLALLLPLAACGRLGYDEITDAAGDGDAPSTDAPGTTPGVLVTCGAATEIIDFGDTGGAAAGFYGIDVAATATGFLVAWSAGNNAINATGLALHDGPRLEDIQTSSLITTEAAATLSIDAIGDAAMLGIDDPDGTGIRLYALNERGFERSGSKYIEGYHAFGHAFVSADAGRDRFVVMASNGTATAAFTRDHDIHPIDDALPAFAVATEGAGAQLYSGGYALITGNSSNCDVMKTDGAMAAVGTGQPIAMTCHHASVVAAPSSTHVVAAWNCDNDQVWTLGGDLSSTLPAFHAIAGDGARPGTNPRVAVTAAGVWYAYLLGTDTIGRALLDADSNVVPGLEATDMHTSANLKAYDLASHPDGDAFLFWLEVTSSTKLYALKLCTP